jgi:hypothetical protein
MNLKVVDGMRILITSDAVGRNVLNESEDRNWFAWFMYYR